MARKKEVEPQNPAEETYVQEMSEKFGPPSGLTCPDCGGALWEIQEGRLTRYRCHVGHQFTQEGLDAEEQDKVEGALWSAIRVLEEHADLRRRMARRAESSGLNAVREAFEKSARDSQQQAHTIRELLFGRSGSSPIPASEPDTARVPTRAMAARVKNSDGRRTNGSGRRPTRRRAR
jgi:two-component system chemotaxis response regulator CheB